MFLQVPGWDLVNDNGQLKLKRLWKVKNFMKGIDLFKNIADVAEAEGMSTLFYNKSSR